jgi:hypothetical protein
MKLVKVYIQDFKAIKNLEKDINGHNIILLGDNGVGKSSFIQFVEIALGRSTSIPEDAMGEGYIITDKDGGEWKFQVRFKAGKPEITVTSPEGMVDKRKSILADVVGAVDFDIDEFVRLSETKSGRKQQVEIYKSFLDDETKKLIKESEITLDNYYRTRTEKNSEIKILDSQLAEHKFKRLSPENIPANRIDITELSKKIDDSISLKEKYDNVVTRIDERSNQIIEINAEIKKLQDKRFELESLNAQANEWKDKTNIEDVSELIVQKDNAVELNANFDIKVDYEKKRSGLNALKEQSENLTIMVETTRQLIADAIRDSQLSVEGLTFDDEHLIWNGVPVNVSNLSSSEIMELGVRMKIAENPNLGMLFIQRGESLGADRLAVIQNLAKELDLQIIMEQVDRGTETLKIEILEEKING